MTQVVHPLTGELLPDDLEALREMEKRVDRYLRSLHTHYAFRDRLRERMAEVGGPAKLPRPRWRTDKQQRVADCPRCGDHASKSAPSGVPGLEVPEAEPNPFHEAA